MNFSRCAAFFCLPALLAAAPPPLVTGAVRDQYGDPIAGARIQAPGAQTRTDASGTFALETQALAVDISCDYCAATRAAVTGDGTVVAIVRRYHAAATQSLSSFDLRALPYGRVESALGLTPFAVLTAGTGLLPGPRLSYYGLSQFGGLVVDNGIAAYDIAAGVTPFRTIPAYDGATFATRDPGEAFRYGDLAAGGSFFIQTQPGDATTSATAVTGNQHAVNLSQTLARGSFNLAGSADQNSAQGRADAWMQFPIGDDTLAVTAIATRDDETDEPSSIDSSMTGARLHYDRNDRARTAHEYADVTADRAQYTYQDNIWPIEGQWTDLSLQTGVETTGKVSLFADAGARFSAGYYDAESLGQPRIAGNIVQTHVSVGAQSQIDRLAWRAGIGAFDVSYAGGSMGVSQPNSARILTPSVALSYDLTPQWNLATDVSESFRLPSLVEAYGYLADTTALYFDRYAMQDVKLSFTDLRRLRLSLVAMRANVSLLDNGPISAAGASVGWQIAPDVSLRAWTMHVDNASQPYAPVFRFGVPPQPATPASVWTTFEDPSGFRADLIWRQDLLDYRPDSHLDASIGAPLSGNVRWFVGTERRAGVRYVSAGLRI